MAVHLAYSTDFLDMKKMRLRVTDDGFTVQDHQGAPVNVAFDWTDLDAFEEALVLRLTGAGRAANKADAGDA